MVVVVGMSEGNGDPGDRAEDRELWVTEGASPSDGAETKPAVIGGMIAVVVGGAGFGVYALYGGGTAADDRTSTSAADQKAEGPVRPALGDRGQTAATRSSRPGSRARSPGRRRHERREVGHHPADRLHQGRPHQGRHAHRGHRTGDKVPFAVKGTVSYKGTEKPLTYDSALTVVRAADGKPQVDWHSAVLHPDLQDGDTLVTGESGTPPIEAVDRDGGEITQAKYPSLGTVLDGLREKYGKTAGGKAGIELRILRAKASKAAEPADKTLLELSKGTPGTVRRR